MLTHGLLCRLAADAPTVGTKTSTHGLSQLARLLQRNTTTRNGLARAYRTAYIQYRRSYATAAAAVKKPAARKPAATKPTATVKRAVKATAAAKKAPAKKAPVKRKVAAKKPAPKKKPATKKKLVAKRKSVGKRAPRVKKVLTPEEEYKLKSRTLKKIALRDPPHVASSAWHAFVAEVVRGSPGTAQEAVKSAGPKFKALSPAEKEHYNHLANEATVAKQAAYKTWIESHTPEEIRAANRARVTLRRRHKENGGKGYPAHTSKIHDERAVKKTAGPYLQFSIERRATGDFKAIGLADSSKLIGEEWKALSEAEKQKYRDVYQAEKAAA